MSEDLVPPGELAGFGPSARRTVALAELEAGELGHHRVGTEHLLLGVIANAGTAAAGHLSEAGVILAAARHKVSEALGTPAERAVRPVGPLPRTRRAARALGRAVRFSHARRAEAVESEDVLLGVLDVEGTAGQVLRGLGVDVARLRAAVATYPTSADATSPVARDAVGRRIAGESPAQPRRARLLVVHHTTSPALDSLLDAVLAGATDEQIDGVDVVVRPALAASALDVLEADGYLLGTPANLGYMSGALKHFFDQIYYPCLNATVGRSFALYVHGNSDTTGAERAVEMIATGLKWRQALAHVRVLGEPSAADLDACRELGAACAAGLVLSA